MGVSAQRETPSVDEVRTMLSGVGGGRLFDDQEWMELLRRAIVLHAETSAMMESYPLSNDSEPSILFARY